MKKTLVSLISDQTIPNLEFIKEFRNQINQYVFICTKQKKSQLKWLTEAANLNKYEEILVDAFEPDEIENNIKQYDFGDDDIILNITGGTKLMSLIINEYFKSIGATIYYLTGHYKTYVKVFPNRGNRSFQLSCEITLNEYLKSHGFSYQKREPFKIFQEAKKMLYFFTSESKESYMDIIKKLQSRRGKNVDIDLIDGLKELLNRMDYAPEKDGKLSKNDVKYLTSDWFEEFVYFKVKTDLNISDEFIGTGYKITKNDVPNELDVIFVYQNKLFIIECKTSIDQKIPVEKEGDGGKKITLKPKNLLPEIVYKSDALRNKFGLFANTSLFTTAPVRDNNGVVFDKLKKHLERAELSRINIIGKGDILSEKTIQELLNI